MFFEGVSFRMPPFSLTIEERIMEIKGFPVEFKGLFVVKDWKSESINDALEQFLDKLPTVDRESYPSKCGVLLSMLGMMSMRIAELQAQIDEGK